MGATWAMSGSFHGGEWRLGWQKLAWPRLTQPKCTPSPRMMKWLWERYTKPTNKIIPTNEHIETMVPIMQAIPMAIPICAPTYTSPHPPECQCSLCVTPCGGMRSQCEQACTYSDACRTRTRSAFTPIQEEPNEWLTTETIRKSICSECQRKIYADQAIQLPCGCSFHSDCVINICTTAHQIILECPDCAKSFHPEEAKPYIQEAIKALNRLADQYETQASSVADSALAAADEQDDRHKTNGQLMLEAAHQLKAKQTIQTMITQAQNIRDNISQYDTKRPHPELSSEQHQANKKSKTETGANGSEIPPTPVTSPAALQHEAAQDHETLNRPALVRKSHVLSRCRLPYLLKPCILMGLCVCAVGFTSHF